MGFCLRRHYSASLLFRSRPDSMRFSNSPYKCMAISHTCPIKKGTGCVLGMFFHSAPQAPLHPRLHHHVPLITQVSNHLHGQAGGWCPSKSPIAGDKQNIAPPLSSAVNKLLLCWPKPLLKTDCARLRPRPISAISPIVDCNTTSSSVGFRGASAIYKHSLPRASAKVQL